MEELVRELVTFSSQYTSINTQSHCHTSRLKFFPFTVLSKNNFNVIFFSFGKLEAKYELYIKTNHSRCFPKECPWNPVAICTHINKVQSF